MYQNLYNLVQQYIFNGVELTGNMDLVATFIATAGVMFMVALPFVLVLKVIRMIMG